MRERSVKNDETDYYRTRETPSTSPGTLGAIFGCPIGPGSGPGRTRRNERVTRRTPHGLGLRGDDRYIRPLRTEIPTPRGAERRPAAIRRLPISVGQTGVSTGARSRSCTRRTRAQTSPRRPSPPRHASRQATQWSSASAPLCAIRCGTWGRTERFRSSWQPAAQPRRAASGPP